MDRESLDEAMVGLTNGFASALPCSWWMALRFVGNCESNHKPKLRKTHTHIRKTRRFTPISRQISTQTTQTHTLALCSHRYSRRCGDRSRAIHALPFLDILYILKASLFPLSADFAHIVKTIWMPLRRYQTRQHSSSTKHGGKCQRSFILSRSGWKSRQESVQLNKPQGRSGQEIKEEEARER